MTVYNPDDVDGMRNDADDVPGRSAILATANGDGNGDGDGDGNGNGNGHE